MHKPFSTQQFPGPGLVKIGRNPHPKGRDFIVADTHGRVHELFDELRAHDFNPAIDRLFSCGDLVDRGPDSLGCLRLLKEKWFFAVLGNHDTMLLTLLRGRYSAYHGKADVSGHSMHWLMELSSAESAELAELLKLLELLPLVMHVENSAGDFNVVHAQLSRKILSGLIMDKDLRDGTMLMEAEPYLTWCRRLSEEACAREKLGYLELGEGERLEVTTKPFEEGVRLTYVGHNRMHRCILHRSHLHFDRGAGYITGQTGESARVLVLEHKTMMGHLQSANLLPA